MVEKIRDSWFCLRGVVYQVTSGQLHFARVNVVKGELSEVIVEFDGWDVRSIVHISRKKNDCVFEFTSSNPQIS